MWRRSYTLATKYVTTTLARKHALKKWKFLYYQVIRAIDCNQWLAITYKGDIAVYTKHSKLLLRYPDSQKIWRYMALDRFKSLIEKESLFFCRADRFDDKWEGIFPIKMIKKFGLDIQYFPSDDGKTYTSCEWHIQKEACSHLINCWHVNDSESFAMWKIYGCDQQDAIAIQSTIGRLKKTSMQITKEYGSGRLNISISGIGNRKIGSLILTYQTH